MTLDYKPQNDHNEISTLLEDYIAWHVRLVRLLFYPEVIKDEGSIDNPSSFLSWIAQTKDNNASQTYDKLSIMFGDLVESLATLSDKFNLNKTANLLSNYERWEATGSKRLLNKMLEDGIIPTNDTLKKAQ